MMRPWLSSWRRRGGRIRRPARPRVYTPEGLERRALPASLTVALASHTVGEDAGLAATTGTVTRAGTDDAVSLTVGLSNSDPSAVGVPATVTIPAGQASATFNVDAVNDNSDGGPQSATITGSAVASAPLSAASGFATSIQIFLTEAVAAQPDGRILAAGSYYNGTSYEFAVTRYTVGGGIDSTFNGGSTVLTSFGAGTSGQAQGVAVTPDGKIVVAGTVRVGSSEYGWGFARYNADGSLDSTFGSSGTLLYVPNTAPYNEIWSVAVQPDGKILAGGDLDQWGTTYDDFSVVRLNPDGTLDTTFGTGGIASVSLTSAGDRALGMVLQTDGKIVLAGVSADGNGDSDFGLVRYNTDGTLDTTFGSGGVVMTAIPGGQYAGANAVALQPDGKIVAVGQMSPTGAFPPAYQMALARYNADGSLDTTFGAGGTVVEDLGTGATASAVAVEPDGMIDVAGGQAIGTNNGAHAMVARFLPGGTLDGSITTSTPGSYLGAVLQPGTGNFIAGGNGLYTTNSFLSGYSAAVSLSGSDVLSVVDVTPPAASDVSVTANEDTSVPVTLSATDADGDVLSYSVVGGPADGTLSGTAPDLVYTPSSGFVGTDSFTYRANDGSGYGNTATVTITVNAVPVAQDDSYAVAKNRSIRIAAPGVLANDTDATTAILVTGPSDGTLVFQSDGSFQYSPIKGFSGTDTFTYRAANGQTLGNVATVTLVVGRAPGHSPRGQGGVGTAISPVAEATDQVLGSLATAPGVTLDATGLDAFSPPTIGHKTRAVRI